MRAFVLSAVVSSLLLSTAPVSAAPSAGSRAAVLQQVENSMRVTGTLHIEADGSVSDVLLDKADRLPAGVAKLVSENATSWRFEPVEIDGQPRAVKTPMSVRVIARQREDGNYEIGIRSANFDRHDPLDPNSLRSKDLRPPRYPANAFRAGAVGTVFLILKINREGRVDDVVAEQVNLGFADREMVMQRYRDLFAENAIKAAHNWTYHVPTTGEDASKPYWVARVPVSYAINSHSIEENDAYGTWKRYVPGPRQTPSWEQIHDAPGFSPDLLDEGVHLADGGNAPRLITPLGSI